MVMSGVSREADGQIVRLHPVPEIGGAWELRDGVAVPATRSRTEQRHHPHPMRCLASSAGARMGRCRARSCRAFTVLYGPNARLLCPQCQRKLDDWRRLPAARRGPFPL